MTGAVKNISDYSAPECRYVALETVAGCMQAVSVIVEDITKFDARKEWATDETKHTGLDDGNGWY